MNTFKLQASAGSTFDETAQNAQILAHSKNAVIEFDFNGIKCLVDKDTDLTLLWRDYTNSWIMDWKEVGPICKVEYSHEIQSELERRKKLREEESQRQQIEYQKKVDAQKSAFDEKVKGVELDLADLEKWDKTREANKDDYGKCAIDYAEGWAKLMQIEMAKGKTLAECAESTSFEMDFYGITGFMYGCAVNVLSSCWKHGEELRKWHNRQYKHEGDGVVNPAVLTINQ